ncbi:MAG: lipopolysaccharide biosynthesis protein [Ktedonobacteraceae bacterium]|nr:lipopolysaccharide biosynthesis protein [Ktedonobacteraceae bacterium]
MGILNRIVKVMMALLTSNLVSLITKLLLPPIFLYRYGTTLYGEWIALSGAVAYLSSLDFGIQTYVTQDLTVRYQRNDLEHYHVQQSTSLRVLLGILITAAIVCLVIFLLPIQSWLHLTISQTAAAETLYLLALQILFGVLFAYFTGMYMVLSRTHTGILWVNGLRMTMVIVASAGAWAQLSFPILAAMQAAVYLVGILLVLLHIRRVAPEIFPRIDLWNRSSVRAILRPSGYFGLISLSTFLSYEVPVLILQREAGPFVVVAFTVMRTIFSMCRQALNAPTQALGPEITRLFGREEWGELTRVYNYSERLIFSLIPMVNLGVLIVSPVLLTIWLHQPALFAVLPYVLMAAISIILSAKEHKFQFQFSTNTHEKLARIMSTSYVALAIFSIPMVQWKGMLGFLYTWLAIELYQTIRIIQLNQTMFAHTGNHRLTYVYRLTALSIVGLVGCGFILAHTSHDLYRIQFAAGAGISAATALAAFFLFDMHGIIQTLSGRMLKK